MKGEWEREGKNEEIEWMKRKEETRTRENDRKLEEKGGKRKERHVEAGRAKNEGMER